MKRSTTRFTIVLVAAIALLPFLFFRPPADEPALKAKKYYQQQNRLLLHTLTALHKQLRLAAPVPVIRQAFAKARYSYKRTEFFTEYYFPLEARLINGPAVPLLEADNTDIPIEPQGFQVLEALLFDKKIVYTEAIKETAALIQTVKNILQKSEALQVDAAGLFFALRLQLVRIITLGITGFDSPVANYSIPEAATALRGVQATLNLFYTKDTGLLQTLPQQAIAYLQQHPRFNSFNRAFFIRQYMHPLMASVAVLQHQLHIPFPSMLMPLKNDFTNLFAADLFNMDFFDGNNDDDLSFTSEKAVLGKKLFFDPALSAGGIRSCGSCHQPDKAFTDGLAKSIALDGHNTVSRNAPTLWNAALQTAQFWDNRVASLEEQIEKVITNSREMNGSLPVFSDSLFADTTYHRLWINAFGHLNRALAEQHIINAIASYIRSLVSLNARADKYLRGQTNDFTAQEINGFNLFAGKAKCATCHFLPLYNGQLPPLYDRQETEVIAVPESKNSSRIDPDKGRYYKYPHPLMEFHFKVPTLRNAALTAPYMHNGVFNTLEEVIDFYDKGGGWGLGISQPNQTLPLQQLNLTAGEKKALLSFLHTLTDKVVIKQK